MRVRVIFNLHNKGATVPFHHQFLLAQVIKGILVKGGDSCFRTYSQYNFSGLKGQTRVGRNGLHFFSKKVTIVLSSPKQAFLDYFLQNLFELPSVEVGNLVLEPDSVDQEAIPVLDHSSKFICLSPIVLTKAEFEDDTHKEFVSPTSPLFSSNLQETIRRRIDELEDLDELKPSMEGFSFEPDMEYLEKIRAGQKKFSRIFPMYDQDVKYEVRGYTLPFSLGGNPGLFRFLMDCGLGEYTYKGFGMLDIGTREYHREIRGYNFRA